MLWVWLHWPCTSYRWASLSQPRRAWVPWGRQANLIWLFETGGARDEFKEDQCLVYFVEHPRHNVQALHWSDRCKEQLNETWFRPVQSIWRLDSKHWKEQHLSHLSIGSMQSRTLRKGWRKSSTLWYRTKALQASYQWTNTERPLLTFMQLRLFVAVSVLSSIINVLLLPGGTFVHSVAQLTEVGGSNICL